MGIVKNKRSKPLSTQLQPQNSLVCGRGKTSLIQKVKPGHPGEKRLAMLHLGQPIILSWSKCKYWGFGKTIAPQVDRSTGDGNFSLLVCVSQRAVDRSTGDRNFSLLLCESQIAVAWWGPWNNTNYLKLCNIWCLRMEQTQVMEPDFNLRKL